MKENGSSIEALREAALSAMRQAYAPYSNFRVGAALRSIDGGITSGCNVENASYPAGICAERSAVAAAVAAGRRQFDMLVLATEADAPTPPCGICRQVLGEFSWDGGLEIVSVTVSGHETRWRLDALLPKPFSPSSLERDAQPENTRRVTRADHK